MSMKARPNSFWSDVDNLAAKLLMKRLLAVADAEQWKAAVEDQLGGARAVGVDDRGWSAREDDALGLQPLERFFGGVEGRDFGIDAGFADAPRNQLGDLAAEVDDEDGFGVRDRHGGPIGIKPHAVQ